MLVLYAGMNGQAEIGHIGAAVNVNEDIRGLEVPVIELPLVGIG